MKYLLLILFLPMFCQAQTVQVDTMTFKYSGICNVNAVSARVLQSRARLFALEYFISPRAVIEFDDVDGGVYIFGGAVPIYLSKETFKDSSAYGMVSFVMKLIFKNGKYKYTISGLNHIAGAGTNCSGGELTNKKSSCGFLLDTKYWIEVKVKADRTMHAFIDRFNREMQNDEVDPDIPEFSGEH